MDIYYSVTNGAFTVIDHHYLLLVIIKSTSQKTASPCNIMIWRDALQSRLNQDDQMSLGNWTFTVIDHHCVDILNHNSKACPKKASPFNTMILEGCYFVALQSCLSQDDQMGLSLSLTIINV